MKRKEMKVKKDKKGIIAIILLIILMVMVGYLYYAVPKRHCNTVTKVTTLTLEAMKCDAGWCTGGYGEQLPKETKVSCSSNVEIDDKWSNIRLKLIDLKLDGVCLITEKIKTCEIW